MMEIASKYDPSSTESKWYKYWNELGFFHSEPEDDREPYTIVIPPPNVTGVLHMGHMLNNTIQDILIRRARMLGKNALWVPGTDHASIATEAKVVAKLKNEGIDKSKLSREEFLQHAWEWKEEHGGIILEQLKKLGASCDWERTCFTMDPALSESVINVFIDLYKKGKIYRGVRMINWDPQAKTAVSDEEVIYKEVQSKLYHLSYKFEDDPSKYLTIATTRPETILGDTAVCVNPKDERYRELAGKKVLVPLINRPVPIIQDDYVDMEFGTGCLKITPAHDINDYEIGIRHHLKSIDIFHDDGTLNEQAEILIGKDRFEARKLIVEELKQAGHLLKVEDYVNNVGFSERTDAVIEPKLSMQWFLAMKEISQPALNAVLKEDIKIYPKKFVNVYRHWMENVKDWCISRQLWWGHRIPAYYIAGSNDFVVAKTQEEALELAREKSGNQDLQLSDLQQDEDVLDTWFSSWLWPVSVFDGIRYPDNKDINYYYPTDVLVTAPEILFFWVARMIISGFEYRHEKPFHDVYLTGIVRDSQRRKMSKSLGNSPDPIKLMDEYGADGVRVGMLLCSPAGNDLLFDTSLTEQGRNFANKIWNAFRLIKNWQTDESINQPDYARVTANWFESRLGQALEIMDRQFETYRLSEALMTIYKLFWDDFSSWFLEIIKPPFGQPIDKKTYDAAISSMEKLVQMLHPFMPFITEEIWQLTSDRKVGESIMMTRLPENLTVNEGLTDDFEFVKEIITKVRAVRKDKNIAQKDELDLRIKGESDKLNQELKDVIRKSANLDSIAFVSEKVEGAASFIVKTTEFFIPLGNLIDTEAEIQRLQKELDYNRGFLASVMRKLNNERFVKNAPKNVVEAEQKKRDDAQSKIRAIEEQIQLLKG
jgi:valyl-tRNA synthetase